jgi:hypothetical protein
MPNLGDTVILRSEGKSGTVVTKDVNAGAREFNANGPYDSIPYTVYGVRVPRMGINQEVVDGDFTGEVKRVPTVNFNGTASLKLNDPTVPWPPMNW